MKGLTGSRQDQYAVHVIVDGVGTGTWDKMSGGAATSEEKKYKPGGMAPSVSLGGTSSVDNVTVSRMYDYDRDHNGLVRTLLAGVGKVKVKVTKQPLDADGVPFGDPLVYRGTLLSCTPPEVDSESNDPGMLEIEISTAGTIG